MVKRGDIWRAELGEPRASGLTQASVVNLSQVVTLDKTFLVERVSRLPERYMREVDTGLRMVLMLA